MTSYPENLLSFLRALREDGLDIGLNEERDALLVIETLGFEERETLKTALKSLLAKNAAEQAVFASRFDLHFVSLAEAEQRRQQELADAQLRAEQMAEADATFRYDDRPIPIREELKDVYIRMNEQDKEKIRKYIDSFTENTKRMPALYRSYIHHMLEQQLMLEDAAMGVTEEESRALMQRDISRLTDFDIPRAIDLIAQLTRKMNRQMDRRQKQRASHGTLDFKRTIGDGLRTGGTFLHLRYHRRPRKRRHLVLLCDVSASMVQFSEFALRFIQSMQSSARDSCTYLFSEQVVRMTPHQMADMDRFCQYVRASGLMGRGTDLSHALQTLLRLQPPVLSDSAMLLIVSDGKTVNVGEAAALLTQAGRRVGDIIWLNPVPEEQWPYSVSITAMRKHSRMLCCSTLEQLSDACEKAFS